MKRSINNRESLPCPIEEVEIYDYFNEAEGSTERAIYEGEPDSSL
jgi:hypothetical protein